jgi:uncharacterized linocin/CFP29 family protein
MSSYLMRDDAPLTGAEWEQLDAAVIGVASGLLVGRRFVPLAGPFGIGTEVVRLDKIDSGGACTHGAEGCSSDECDCDLARIVTREFVPLPLIHKDFMLSWRDIEAARQSGSPLELGPAAAAAAAVARAEDASVFAGLLSVEGTTSADLGDWSEPGSALASVSAAAAALARAGYIGPYTLVVSPDLYALLQRPFKGSGRLEYKLVESVADGGILQAPALDAGQALMAARGAHYLDLAVGQDLITAYLGPEGMDHRFRVLESMALRVKQPAAICTFA